ncbi:hypothetical protein [Acinetobacter modestus]|uniref:hypothetical protein n=1 Tax=Acinetobacter modestus TaxID=1776740 RepID=UPI001F4A5636|nr:hypothetical protein [Acinetobacter modestus]
MLTLILFTTFVSGCQKQPETKLTDADHSKVEAQFNESDKKIGEYLDVLDDPKASKELKTKIICEDYPWLYNSVYMPALLKLSPKDNNEMSLKKDLKLATDYYANKLSI